MAKDHVRDYATAAFRFLARWGSRDTYVTYLLADLQCQRGSGIGSPTEAEIMHKEAVMREYAAELADLEAAERALENLRVTGYFDVVKAVKMVYLEAPHKELERGDIKKRVHHAELHIPASESTIYRWLAKARRMFAEERGLRVNKKF